MRLCTNQSLQDAATLRVILFPVGGISRDLFEEYADHLRAFETVLIKDVNEDIEKPLSNPNGKIRFRFVREFIPSDWDSFQSNRKVYGMIGIAAACTVEEIQIHHSAFLAEAQCHPTVKAYRCIVFNSFGEVPTPEQKWHVVPHQGERELIHFHLRPCFHEFVSDLVHTFERLRKEADTTMKCPRTPIDNLLVQEDINKANRRRRPGRIQKVIADYCLLSGCPLDARTHYLSAIEQAKSGSDWVWLAGALEGYCTALVNSSTEDPLPTAVVDEILDKYFEAIGHYNRLTKDFFLEVEASFRQARFMASQKRPLSQILEVVMRIYTQYEELGFQDQIVLMGEMSLLCQELGAHRKFAFFLRQMAALYKEIFHWSTAHDILLLAAKFYQLDVSSIDDKLGTTRLPEAHMAAAPSPGSTFKNRRDWTTIQKDVMLDLIVMSKTMKDTIKTAGYISFFLRTFKESLTRDQQLSWFEELLSLTSHLCYSPQLDMVGLPQLVNLAPQALPEHLQPVVAKPVAGDSKNPFLFCAFAPKKKRQQILWTQDEPMTVVVQLSNPFAFEIAIDNIVVASEGVPLETYPTATTLSAQQHCQTVELVCKPLAAGTLKIIGVEMRLFNVHCLHPVDDSGIPLSLQQHRRDESRRREPNPEALTTIRVVSPLPLLSLTQHACVMNQTLYDGQAHHLVATFYNTGVLPITTLAIGITPDCGLSWTPESLQAKLPLLPGSLLSIDEPVDTKLLSESMTLTVEYGSIHNSEHARNLAVVMNLEVVKPLRLLSFSIVDSRLSLADTAHTSVHAPTSQLVGSALSRRTDNFTESIVVSRGDGTIPSSQFCMLMWETRNSSPHSFRLHVSVAKEISTENQTGEHIPGWSTFAFVVQGNSVSRVVLPIRRFSFHDEWHQSGHVASKEELEARAERYKTALVERVCLEWHSGYKTSGSLPLQPFPLTASLLQNLTIPPIEISLHFGLEQSSSTVLRCALRQCMPLRVTLTNRTAAPLTARVSLRPSRQCVGADDDEATDANRGTTAKLPSFAMSRSLSSSSLISEDGDSARDLSEDVLFVNSLQTTLTVAANASADHTVGVFFLAPTVCTMNAIALAIPNDSLYVCPCPLVVHAE